MAKAKATEQILREFKPDFTAVYLRLTDIAQHKFWHSYEPEAFGLGVPAGPEDLSQLIPSSYELMDELLAGLLKAAGEDTSVIILSDHGGGPWVLSGLRGVVGRAIRRAYHPEYSGHHRLDGILVFDCPAHRLAKNIGDAYQIDFVLTVLGFFGLPLAEDMPGRALVDWPRNPNERQQRRVPTNESDLPPIDPHLQESEVDDEIQRQLESLGYIQ